MLGSLGILEIIIILANITISIQGFNNPAAFESGTFQVGKVLQGKEYQRLLTSGFLHVSWPHLFFNMLSLYFFAGHIEAYLGPLKFLLIYVGSLLGGNLLALFIHRNDSHYRAVGASGAVSGVIFAAIALFPGMELGLLFIPIPFPAWAFGLGFVLYSIYGIRAQRDNIGHEAHLGGAIVGLLIAVALLPQMLLINTLPIVLVLIPTLIFIFIIIYRPQMLGGGRPTFYQYYEPDKEDMDHKYNAAKNVEAEEVNRILDKIGREGEDSLTAEERETLKNFRS
jgi:membrane associated rhomboid family serine protease